MTVFLASEKCGSSNSYKCLLYLPGSEQCNILPRVVTCDICNLM